LIVARWNGLSDEDKEFILDLAGLDYGVNLNYGYGLKMLINRTLLNDEGGFWDADLVTDYAEMDDKGKFKIIEKMFGRYWYFNYTEREEWRWSVDGKVFRPFLEPEEGSFDSVDDDIWRLYEKRIIFSSLYNLKDVEFYEGASIIFSFNPEEEFEAF